MKIDNTPKPAGSSPVGPGSGSGLARPAKGAASTPAGSGTGDQVQLSPLSSRMQAMQSSMADTPVVDMARVAEIRLAITEGRFKVNPDAVADQLLQAARELLSSRLH